MKIKVRLLNEKGLQKFSELHEEIVTDFLPKKITRRGAPISSDQICEIINIADNPVLTREISGASMHIDPNKKFSSKFELGEYLYKELEMLPKGLLKSKELWSWLALVYIKQLLVEKAGKHEIHSQYRYIFDYSNAKSWMRHTLHFSHYTYSKLQSDSIAFLWQPPFESGDFTNLAARPEILTNRNLARFFYEYFFDKEEKKYVAGFTSKGVGWNMRSFFGITLKELKMNFDPQECELEQLFHLVPEGYKKISTSR
jgi:hypothetical protein